MSAHGRALSGLQRVVKALLLAATTLASAGSAAAGTPIERGRYLVESILACGNCHTPKSPAGEPIMERNMAGGLMITAPSFAGAASNITPDRETGIGAWSDAEIRRAIVEGVRPGHGRLPNTQLAVMPVTLFKALLLAAAALASAGSAAAGTPVERGRYLVESILACGNCLTPSLIPSLVK